MAMLNMTRHVTTLDMMTQGIEDMSDEHKNLINELMTFSDIPTLDEINSRSDAVVEIISNYDITECLIDPPNYLVLSLVTALSKVGYKSCFPYMDNDEYKGAIPSE